MTASHDRPGGSGRLALALALWPPSPPLPAPAGPARRPRRRSSTRCPICPTSARCSCRRTSLTTKTQQYEFSSTHPVHVDSGFFGLDVSNDTGTDEHCSAQITVSPYSSDVASPRPYVDELGTKLCDADWFVTADRVWQQDTGDPDLWVIETTARSVGWFSTSEGTATGVVVVDAARGVIVGLWAEVDVYSPVEAVSVARQVARLGGLTGRAPRTATSPCLGIAVRRRQAPQRPRRFRDPSTTEHARRLVPPRHPRPSWSSRPCVRGVRGTARFIRPGDAGASVTGMFPGRDLGPGPRPRGNSGPRTQRTRRSVAHDTNGLR